MDLVQEPVPEAPGPEDWSQQVQRWMSARKETRQEEEVDEVEKPARPPQPETMDDPVYHGDDSESAAPPSSWAPPSPRRVEEHRPADPVPQAPLPAFPAFQFVPQQPQDRSRQQAQAQDFAASFLAGALGNLEKAKAQAHQTPSMFDASVAPPTASSGSAPPQAQRSRSRGRRSQSPRRRSPARGGGRDSATNNFASRTIQITTGAVTTRLWLKKEMERFGRVEVCHTGNRMNPEIEAPWVRFEKMTAVETALEAINAGQCISPDGVTLKAELKNNSRPPPPTNQTAQPRPQPTRRDLETTSRDLARDDRRSGPGNYSSRDAAQDDRRRSPRRRSPPRRQQMGPGNYSSRDLARDDRRRSSSSSSSRPQRRLPMGPGNYSSRELARMDARRRR